MQILVKTLGTESLWNHTGESFHMRVCDWLLVCVNYNTTNCCRVKMNPGAVLSFRETPWKLQSKQIPQRIQSWGQRLDGKVLTQSTQGPGFNPQYHKTKTKQHKTTHQSLFIWVISVFILNFYFVCIHKTKENTKSRAIQVLPEQGTLPPGKIKK